MTETVSGTPGAGGARTSTRGKRGQGLRLERVYTQIGKSVVSKFLWLVGAGTLAVAAWLNGAGYFHK